MSRNWHTFIKLLFKMRKLVPLTILLLVCIACGNIQEVHDGLLRIPVNVDDATTDASTFLEKIEIVPLETNDSVLFNYPSEVIYDKNTNMYAVTSRMDVFTFTGEGKAIGNSTKKRGQGPDEYSMILDMKFNHFLNGIDLLNPYGVIYTYSPTFELLARRNFKPEFPVNHFMALDTNNYAFTFPFIWTDQEVAFVNIETGNTVNAKYQGTISEGNGLKHQYFHKVGDRFYFIPRGVNYNIYQIDTLKKEIFPIIYLDFGEAEIKEDGLPGRASGKRTDNDKERMKIADDFSARHNFLRESTTHFIPMQTLLSENYIYIFIVKGQERYGRHYIYNRVKKKGYLIKIDVPFCMYDCFGIDDNVLLAICQPTELPQYVDCQFMTEKEIAKMERLKEDDNPVIIKYYLKR